MNGLTKIDDKTETYIGLTKLDLEKYSDFLTQKYNLKLKEIETQFKNTNMTHSILFGRMVSGGCILFCKCLKEPKRSKNILRIIP